MPADFIAVDRNAKYGRDVSDVIRSILDVENRLGDLKARLDHMTDGADYSQIETHCGVPTGNGDELYNVIAGAITELGGDTNIRTLIERFG
jgi:hypothetical protein